MLSNPLIFLFFLYIAMVGYFWNLFILLFLLMVSLLDFQKCLTAGLHLGEEQAFTKAKKVSNNFSLLALFVSHDQSFLCVFLLSVLLSLNYLFYFWFSYLNEFKLHVILNIDTVKTQIYLTFPERFPFSWRFFIWQGTALVLWWYMCSSWTTWR